MQKLSFIIFTLIIVIFVFLPLFSAIESGFNSTGGYYGDFLTNNN